MRQFFSNLTKYVVEGLVVAIVAYYIPKRETDLKTVAMIGLIAALTFALLDFFSPSIGASSRLGAGFGIGSNLVGFGQPSPYTGAPAGGVVPSVSIPTLESYSNAESYPQYINVQTTAVNTQTVPAVDAVGNEILVSTPTRQQSVDGIHSMYANPIDGVPLGTTNQLSDALVQDVGQ